MNRNFLIITATHGNEAFGVKTMRQIENKFPPKKHCYDWIIGNPRAFKKKARFTQADLNRSAPGNLESKIYEKKLAAKLINLSQKYKFALDIHGTNSKSGIFTLVTNPVLENLLLAASLPIKNIVIWASKSSLKNGPITQDTKCPAVEIECGPKNSKEIQKNLKFMALVRILIL